jgi:hypothetical protein
LSDETNPFSREAHTAQYAGSPHQPPSPPRKSSRGWLVGLLVLLVLMPLVCCGGLVIIGFSSAVAGIRAPVEAAVDALNRDPAVAAKLGTPISASTSFGVNEYQNHNGNGGATVEFTAMGRDQSGQVSGRMSLNAGNWKPESLTIQCGDGTKLTVP